MERPATTRDTVFVLWTRWAGRLAAVLVGAAGLWPGGPAAAQPQPAPPPSWPPAGNSDPVPRPQSAPGRWSAAPRWSSPFVPAENGVAVADPAPRVLLGFRDRPANPLLPRPLWTRAPAPFARLFFCDDAVPDRAAPAGPVCRLYLADVGSGLRRAGFQEPKPLAELKEEDLKEFGFQVEPPGPDRIFQLESEEAFKERIRQDERNRPQPQAIPFPDEPPVSRGQYAGRHWPDSRARVEPNYVCYRRLFFEEKNSERYGWSLGFAQPFVSAGAFYADLVTLPYRAATEPCRKFECSAGYCLPGDPVPYLLYPPQLSLTGLTAQAGAVAALIAIFP